MDSRTSYLQSAGYLDVSKSVKDKIDDMYAITTKNYGPYWFTLFTMILGQYPVKVDWDNTEHKNITKHFYYLLSGLRYTLPCQYCRASFTEYFEELPIKKFMNSRIDLALWLYLMKDKVNTKLIGQENDFSKSIEKDYINGIITKNDFLKQKQQCFHTTPSPPFESILEYYSQFSAMCSKKIQKCVSKDTLIF
jgi:hypothetical protein